METSVYLSGKKLKIAVGNASPKGFAIKSFISVPMPAGTMINGIITSEWEIKKLLAEVWSKYKLPKKDISITIDSGSIFLKPMVVPITNEDNLTDIIKREFSDLDNTEEMLFDYSIEKPHVEGGGAMIVMYAAEKSLIGSYVDLFSEIKGARIKSIAPAQNSCMKLMRMCGEMSQKTAILAVLDGNMLSLMLFVNGAYRFSNRSRLISERGTPEISDEISSALSYIIQFNRSERSGFDVTDIYFCGINEEDNSLINMMSLLFDKQNVEKFPYLENRINLKKSKLFPLQSFEPTDYVFCLGNIIKN